MFFSVRPRDKANCFDFNVLLRRKTRGMVSPLLLCSRGLGGHRILHQIGRFDEIAKKIRQGWEFFEQVRPNFARKLVNVKAQLSLRPLLASKF